MPTLNINNDDIRLNSSSSDKVVVNGNLGVGTTSPSEKLHVYGNIKVDGQTFMTSGFSSYTTDGLFSASALWNGVITPSGVYRIRLGYLDQGGGQYWGRIGFVANTNWSLGTSQGGNSFSIGTGNGNNEFLIDNTGNVGIGTTSPTQILSISRVSTDNYIKVEAGGQAANYSGLMLTEYGINWGWTLRKNAATDLLHISYQDNTPTFSDVVTFDRNGNVGIGTTSPQAGVKLDVYGATAVAGGSEGLRIGSVGDNSAYDNVKIWYAGYNSGAPRVYLTPRTTPGSGVVETYFHLQNTNGNSTTSNNTMGLLVDGNVGIGTTSPGSRLTVSKSYSTYSPGEYLFQVASGFNASNPMFGVEYSSDAAIVKIGYVGLGSTVSRIIVNGGTGNGDSSISFYNQSTLGTYISSATSYFASGNVGIGTTSPAVSLQVNASTAAIRLEETSASAKRLEFSIDSSAVAKISANQSAQSIAFETVGSERMRITDAGNVGIGTTSPNRKLYVVSSDWDNVTGGGVIFENSNTVGASLTLKPSASVVTNGSNGWAVYAGGPGAAISDGNLGFWAHGTNEARMVIQRGGNVGIGTISPTAKLEIRNDDGGSSETVDKFSIRGGDGGNNQIMKVEYLQDAGVLTLGYAGLTGDSVNLNGGTSNVGSTVALNNGGTTKVFFHSNGNSYFNAGNVGIGTTAPQQLLHVLGATNGYMMVQGANDAGQAGIYFKKEDTTGTMDRTKGLIVFHTNVGSGFGRGHLGFCLNSADSNTVVSISDEKFRMVDNGDFLADGDVVAYSTTISDERYKTNITPIDSALDKVNQMRGVSFDWTAVRSGREFGVIAQEIEKIAPEVVSEKELLNGETMKTVSYTSLVPFLIESIKELTARVEELEQKLKQ
jgi:hypothetical protein